MQPRDISSYLVKWKFQTEFYEEKKKLNKYVRRAPLADLNDGLFRKRNNKKNTTSNTNIV